MFYVLDVNTYYKFLTLRAAPPAQPVPAKRAQQSTNMEPTTFQKRGPGGYLIGRSDGLPHWVGQESQKKQLKQQKVGALDWCRPILAEHGSDMAPTWLPKWSQDGQNIDTSIVHFF